MKTKSAIFVLGFIFIIFTLFVFLKKPSTYKYSSDEEFYIKEKKDSLKFNFPPCKNHKTFVFENREGNLEEIKFEKIIIREHYGFTSWLFYDCHNSLVLYYHPEKGVIKKDEIEL